METFPIKLLVNEQDSLSEQESVTIEDLKNRPLYIESSQFAIYHLIMKKCEEAGFQPDIAFQTSGFSLCHKMVKENKGISVTVDFVFDDMKEQGLRLIPFSEESFCIYNVSYGVSGSLYRNGSGKLRVERLSGRNLKQNRMEITHKKKVDIK